MSATLSFPEAPSGADLLRESRALLRGLARDVERLASDEWFRMMLWGMARTRNYGIANIILIHGQCPRATWVRGRKQWEATGRRVREGEKPIWILAPGRPDRPYPFYSVKVYDVTQTVGPALPSVDVSYGGDPRHLPRIEAAAGRLGLTVERLDPETAGWDVLGTQCGRVVRLRKDLRPIERCRVLAHEYAHALLHAGSGKRPDLPVLEAEADATAWVTLQSLGIRCPSPAYIASHGGTGKSVLSSMRRIQAAARAILEAVEGRTPRVRIPPYRPPGESRRRNVKLHSRRVTRTRGRTPNPFLDRLREKLRAQRERPPA